MDFENYYLSSLFRETGENINLSDQKTAVRNSLVRLHNESVKRLSNAASSVILSQKLEEYSNVSTDQSQDSNDKILTAVNSLLKGNIQTRHCADWKSGLRSSKNAKEITLKSLKRSGHCNVDNNSPCEAGDVVKDDLQKLLKKKSFSSQKTKTDSIVTITTDQTSLNVNTNNLFKPKVMNANLEKGNELDKSQAVFSLKQYHNLPENSSVFSSNEFNVDNNCKDSFNGHNSRLGENGNKRFFNNPTSVSSQNRRQFQNLNDTNLMETKSNNGNYRLQKSNEDSNRKVNGFWTARAELQIQNKKKYGNSKQNYPIAPEPPVVVKRSLGTTRSSVQSKFKPPFATSSESQSSQEEATEETVEDERLKHIDPKMIEFIRSEIIDSSAPISWDDIAGLEFAKSAIQEAVVWPLLRPDIFTGLRRPPKGILLFGPPGTGKTLIGKCIASQCCATFFSISASSLTSKWIGDGEKMVRALFAVARCHQPAVVFIDEIDSLLTQRSDNEHEATRRIKTEFLVQLDGAATGDEDRFLVIGATNRPQELDEAARRRLVKRLYIPLPDSNARTQIVQRLMSTERNSLSNEDIQRISHLTEGYSGADMRSLCSEAALGPIRAVPLSQITNIQCDQVRPVSAEDFEKALTRVRPSVSGNDLHQYTLWDNTYGSGSGIS